MAENHKGVRPYACSLCEKTYGRRDYLQRHLKSHNANYAVNLQSASSISASQVVQKVQMPSKNTIILQQGQGGTLQVKIVNDQDQEIPRRAETFCFVLTLCEKNKAGCLTEQTIDRSRKNYSFPDLRPFWK